MNIFILICFHLYAPLHLFNKKGKLYSVIWCKATFKTNNSILNMNLILFIQWSLLIEFIKLYFSLYLIQFVNKQFINLSMYVCIWTEAKFHIQSMQNWNCKFNKQNIYTPAFNIISFQKHFYFIFLWYNIYTGKIRH